MAENSSVSGLKIMGSKNACALEFACILERNIKCSVIIIIIIIIITTRGKKAQVGTKQSGHSSPLGGGRSQIKETQPRQGSLCCGQVSET